MRPVQVCGIGLWTPGFACAADWRDERQDPAVTRPQCALLDSRIGRFTSLVTRIAVEAAAQAAAQGGADLEHVPVIFGSAYGEVRTAFELLDMIEREGVPEPARFKNSVHNTASGHVSIATGNTGFGTSLAAGSATFAMCLLEAFAWLEVHRGSVIVSVADEPLPDHLGAAGRYEPLAVALQLTAGAEGAALLGELSNLHRGNGADAPAHVPAQLIANPSAAALPLVCALLHERGGTVPVAFGKDGWSVELSDG